MSTKFQSIIDTLTTNPKKLFLIDGVGAFITTFSLGVTLTSFESYFGMPLKILYILSVIAGIYAVYSFCCHFFLTMDWQPYLWTIAVANFVYCCLTAGLLFYFYQRLTVLGVAYFLLEILIIGGLVTIELKVQKNLKTENYTK